MNLTDSLNLAFVLFMLVTVPLYILLLVTLYRNRHEETLKSAFFKLMFSIGIADLGMITVLILGNTLAGSGWVPQVYILLGGLSAKLTNAGMFGFGLAQNIGVFVIAISRYTAYIRPLNHSKIWTDKFARNIIIAQWILSFIAITPILFYYEFNICLQTDNRTVLLQWTDPSASTIYNVGILGILSSGFAIIIVIICTIVFGTAIIRKIRSQQPMSKVEVIALKMAGSGFVSSIGLLIYLVDMYANLGPWYLFGINVMDAATFWLIFNISNSIYAAVNPYALFLFSSTVRQRFAELFCCNRLGQSSSEQTATANRIIINVQPAPTSRGNM